MKVTIELDEDQAYTVMNALEFYARIKMGQFEEIHSTVCNEDCARYRDIDMNIIRDIEYELKRAIFPELALTAYYGIHSKQVGKFAQIAWDVYQSMRHDIWWVKEPTGGYSVNFDKPHHVCTDRPLPKVTVEME